mmetsp:Transcript_14192/g.23493  ORF Transcript_14192/g.23493 Transcript_14192/m.23493 type:complete len:414 (+) Transcript_14192:140-1381(+)|eukprot:CAMPEP_0184648472 /NCGR_PEP_ID=MMETSP0308-20130426/5599_1 /TAXON_ID=38269 /ORGANISM="Gloeochaete witrockiana, Strain SAG 46.84" /LENGTH=413 /DNA_ID=CAMNT_0027080321 /DNA_START=106 /DNA_END=1347 /DNA_ORIENTATION=-
MSTNCFVPTLSPVAGAIAGSISVSSVRDVQQGTRFAAPRSSNWAVDSAAVENKFFGSKSLRADFFGARAVATATRSANVSFTATRPALVIEASRKPGTAIVTGASSGVGLWTTKALVDRGWHVLMAVRDIPKASKAAKDLGLPSDKYTLMELDLKSLDSVRSFVKRVQLTGRQLDSIVVNAAVYFPRATAPTRTVDGFEESVGVNHLGHFLLVNLLLNDLKKSGNEPRLVVLGTVTHNPKELGGKIPPQPRLGDMRGLANGFKAPYAMIDGGEFNGAKAYKDSKVCNILTMFELHRRFHDKTGIVFSSLYPGCVATTGLFRNHYNLFQTLFPLFQKNITGGFISEELSGLRVADVVTEDEFGISGGYFSWGNRQKEGRKWFLQEVSDEAGDSEKGKKLWELSEKLVGLVPARV